MATDHLPENPTYLNLVSSDGRKKENYKSYLTNYDKLITEITDNRST